MFSEKASATARIRQKYVKNASEMRQKCVRMGLVLLRKEEHPKCVRHPSKLRQKCVKNARNTFGGEHLLDDTDFWVRRPPGGVGVFHSKGWWPKTSCPPSKVCLPWVFEGRNLGCPGIFVGMSRTLGGVQKVCTKKVRTHFSFPKDSWTKSRRKNKFGRPQQTCPLFSQGENASNTRTQMRAKYPKDPAVLKLLPWWTFRIFLVFCRLGGGERGSPRRQEGAGVGFLLTIPGGGGAGLPRRGGGGRVAWRVFVGNSGGGGLTIFFWGRNFHQATA